VPVKTSASGDELNPYQTNVMSGSYDNTQRRAEEVDARLLGLACWTPLIAFLTLFGFAAIGWVRVDHWPHYANPDPKDLHLPVLHAAALLAYPLALVSIPACLLVLVLAWNSLRLRDVIIYTSGASLWAFVFPITGSLFEWLID
jgi:hypothetical protein